MSKLPVRGQWLAIVRLSKGATLLSHSQRPALCSCSCLHLLALVLAMACCWQLAPASSRHLKQAGKEVGEGLTCGPSKSLLLSSPAAAP